MSDDQYDRFNDVIQGTAGIFGQGLSGMDDGLKSFEKPQVHVAQPGVIVEMQCRGCGKPRRLTFEWPEIIALRFDMSPQVAYQGIQQLQQFAQVPWVRGADGWWPNMACSKCRGHQDATAPLLRPIFTPEECTGHVRKALANGWLMPAQEQQLSNLVAQRKQQLMQQRPAGY